MADYLLDTNTFSFIVQEHPRVLARFAALTRSDRALVSTIARGEILFGLESLPASRRRRILEAKIAALFAQVVSEPVPIHAAEVYARFRHAARRLGTPLDDNDLWIAATAETLGAVLVTSDSDFSRLPGLAAEDWTT